MQPRCQAFRGISRAGKSSDVGSGREPSSMASIFGRQLENRQTAVCAIRLRVEGLKSVHDLYDRAHSVVELSDGNLARLWSSAVVCSISTRVHYRGLRDLLHQHEYAVLLARTRNKDEALTDGLRKGEIDGSAPRLCRR